VAPTSAPTALPTSLPTEYDGPVTDIPPGLVVTDGEDTVAADWFKISATATGRTGDFDESTLGQLKTATASLVRVDEAMVVLFIAAGTDEDTVMLKIAVADDTAVEGGPDSIILGDDFGSLFSSAVAEMGISVVGDVSAVKIIDGSQKTSFKQVFGESNPVGAEVGSSTVLSLAEVDASAKAGQAPMSSVFVAAPIVGALTAALFFGVLRRRMATSTPVDSLPGVDRLALSAHGIASAGV